MPKKITDVLVTNTTIDNPYFEALLGIMMVTNQHLRRQAEFFAPYGITPPQYNVLRILRGQHPNPCQLNLIKERIVDKNSDVSRLIDRMRTEDLVTRTINPQDRRAVDILISDKGLALLKTLDPLVTELWRLNGISENEAKTMVLLLEKIIE